MFKLIAPPLLLALFFQGCTSVFLYPDHNTYTTPESYGLNYDEVYFPSEDKTSLHAWHIYPRTESKGLLFVAHGNAQNLSAHFVSWVWLLKAGYEVFIFDYRGYGRSQGESEIEGSIKDTAAALAYVDMHYEKAYFACGQSLGGTMLLNAMQERDNPKIKAVIIDSTFTGFSDIAAEKMNGFFLTWPFQWIPRLSLSDRYDAKDRVSRVNKPLLFLHGSLDKTISPNHSWQLFESAPMPRELWLVKDARHTQALENEAVQKDFLEFLQLEKAYYAPYYSRMRIYE